MGRLACVENNQAQPLQQQQQPVAAQSPGGIPLGGLMAPCAAVAMGGQHPPAPQDALQQAAVTAGVKANAKQAADLWSAKEGAKFFIAREVYYMPEDIDRALLFLVLDKVAHVSEKAITQLKALSEFAVPARETLLADAC